MLMKTDKPITVVPAKEKIPVEFQTLRVAIYARVSTKQDEQYNSLESQVMVYENIISANPFWELADIYSEKASGKNVDNRKEFDRLLKDVKKGKIDLILTKSISRFSRDALVTLEKLATLKQYGVNIIFDKERIDYMNTEESTHIAIMAAFAQVEIENLSEDIKWGLRQKAKGKRWHK